jgi:hypothetical protein
MEEMNYFGLGGGILGVISVMIGIVIKLNHKRCRSHCCGRDVVVAVDVEETTPVEKTVSRAGSVTAIQIPAVRDGEPVKEPCKT